MGVQWHGIEWNPRGVHLFTTAVFRKKEEQVNPAGVNIFIRSATPGRVQLPSATDLNRGLFLGKPRWGYEWAVTSVATLEKENDPIRDYN